MFYSLNAGLSTKKNTYFVNEEDQEWNQRRYESMIKNYQQVSPRDFYQFRSEREMLSSQYSSVASIIQDKCINNVEHNIMDSSIKSKKNLVIKQVNFKKIGKKGKRVFPKAEGGYSTAAQSLNL